ncbi:Coenzyme F420 hydrogenase/dehydrogenase, beta subunit C-terminal domain [Roseospirillum parvum]|uniref:Coenzyme F420 hydrogenase subunit beta n=1 Tax=Roseospirillum parvum TaxID=83401 RepID=A0A1G7ZVQ9_9PROT|nr:Coenzyme F420 hydrogenase/dehydrogenase, beta subunit C-terminal domain [Roseospirillum parvum]SDH12742.1 coenzyme F420 hydrogenase subunit beta [Roseospirillum parvum]
MPDTAPATAPETAPETPPLAPPVARDLCTDCGLSRTAEPRRCGRACQFMAPDYPALEARVHGRARDPGRGDERFFGPYRAMHRARLEPPRPGAQWSGLTTRLGQRLLESGRVEAVLATAPDPADPWRPRPVLITEPAQLAGCRGMRMGVAPLLALLETARQRGIRRLGVIGIPCQIYPLRALEAELGFDEITVIGIPCSDNTSTENFHHFLGLLTDAPERVTYLEFMPDYHVELRFSDRATRRIPFLKLPLSKLPADFFPLTCKTCVDYVNVLADLTVGYMAGQGEQWLIVRNEKGAGLLELLGDEVVLSELGDAGKRTGSVKGFLANTERAAGGLPTRAMPDWARPIVAWLMPRTGPRGLELARARLEMKALETIVHLRHAHPKRLQRMVPEHVWRLAEPYGLTPTPDERGGGERLSDGT